MSSRSSYKICDFCGKNSKHLKENQRIYQVDSDVEAFSDFHCQAHDSILYFHAPDSNRFKTIGNSNQINSSTGID